MFCLGSGSASLIEPPPNVDGSPFALLRVAPFSSSSYSSNILKYPPQKPTMGENRGFPLQSRVYSEVVQLYIENLKSIVVFAARNKPRRRG
jgi:hypothetical protein